AVTQYVTVANHFQLYPRMDEVLYDLGYLLTQAKKTTAALGYYKRLINDHPSSKLISDAYLAFGDHYFDEKQPASAIRFYERISPESRVYRYSQYKSAWCQ